MSNIFYYITGTECPMSPILLENACPGNNIQLGPSLPPQNYLLVLKIWVPVFRSYTIIV